MHLIVLHGTVGIWDEVACLAIPATVILGVALAVLREKPRPDNLPGAADQSTDDEVGLGERPARGEQS